MISEQSPGHVVRDHVPKLPKLPKLRNAPCTSSPCYVADLESPAFCFQEGNHAYHENMDCPFETDHVTLDRILFRSPA
jgi:hypothetical protein